MEDLNESDSSDDIFRPKSKKSLRLSPHESINTIHDRTLKTHNASNAIMFSCKFCGRQFNQKNNCNRHENMCKANFNRAPTTFPCSHCKKTFTRKSFCSQHEHSCNANPDKSSPGFSQEGKKNKTPCFAPNCSEKFYFKYQLIQHMFSVHQDLITIHPKVSKTFSCIKEFNLWKEKEEESTYSYFTARHGQASSSVKYYYCQHDGSKKLHDKHKRKSSKCPNKGRVKVGHHCIAKMKVSVHENKSVLVDYYPTHSHVCKKEDMLHHPLPSAMSEFIDKKLSENIPPTVVHDLVKELFLPKDDLNIPNTRAGTLKKKTVLERGRRRRMKRRLHKDDAKAVYLLAHKLLETDNSLLIYKPYGEKVVHGPEEINQLPNSKELFMFAMQTDRQLELLKKHGSKIVIVDETHGTNQYKYHLLTVMIVDENRRGWAVAHLITSKSDAETLQYFFKALHLRLNNEVSLNCVITDDDPALINAMKAGFNQEFVHILCKWHVLKNLKDNLRAKVPKELFQTILSEMKVIINEENENVFLKLKDGFRKKLKENKDVLKYACYLEQYYWNKAEKWAMCYRNFPHAGVNTTGHLESLHNRLKKCYLKRRVNKRLDDLIEILFTMEWDDHCSRQREASVGFSVQPQDILERHKRGLLMDDSMIIEQTLDRQWEIKSADINNCKTYFVERYKESCNYDMCFSKCTKAECHSLCSHLFSCSCPDHHPLCKHIHKIQSYLNGGEPFVPIAENFYNFETDKSDEQPFNEETEGTGESFSNPHKKAKNINDKLKGKFSHALQLLNTFPENAAPEHITMRLDTDLSDFIHAYESEACQGKADEVQAIPSMDPAVSFAPNEKLKTQISQLASFKKPPKRKKIEDRSVAAAKKQVAMEDLLLTITMIPMKIAEILTMIALTLMMIALILTKYFFIGMTIALNLLLPRITSILMTMRLTRSKSLTRNE